MLVAVKRFFELAFNVGWFFPLYLSSNAVIHWCRLEVAPAVYGTPGIANSFPYLQFAEDSLMVAAIWLSSVVIVNSILRRPLADWTLLKSVGLSER